jgi:ureidoglycolate lyase
VQLREVTVKAIRPTQENFAKFGTLIELPKSAPSVSAPGVLDYWDKGVKLDVGGGNPELGFLTTRFRPFEFTTVERHVKSDETFIPLEGKACVFALAPASDPHKNPDMPDPDEVVAFILDGSVAVNLSAGVWHWAPFPSAENINFVLALRDGTVEHDIDLKDTAVNMGITFKVVLCHSTIPETGPDWSWMQWLRSYSRMCVNDTATTKP